ncbi:hypothetical protein FQR65_LT17077 [Abscondita terminalis]|nr:hypothetical protein FQR65_LT17077 [Abscondita terminalis]
MRGGKCFILSEGSLSDRQAKPGGRIEREDEMKFIPRCSEKNCRGRVIWRMGAEIEIEPRANHNHDPDLIKISVLRFKEALRHRASSEVLSLRNIFIEEQVRHHDASLQVDGFSGAIEKIMMRARKLNTPPIPTNFQEIDEILRNPRYSQRFSNELGPTERPFYGGLLGEEAQKVLYFVSPTVQHYARTQENPLQLHMDATFSVVPRTGGAMQLFIVHLLYSNFVFPLAYCMMERRNMESYRTVLQLIKNQVLGNRAVASVMTDYERALRQAIAIEFPNSVLRGCWFHYWQKSLFERTSIALNGKQQPKTRRKDGYGFTFTPSQLFQEGRQAVNRWLVENTVDHDIHPIEQFALTSKDNGRSTSICPRRGHSNK